MDKISDPFKALKGLLEWFEKNACGYQKVIIKL